MAKNFGFSLSRIKYNLKLFVESKSSLGYRYLRQVPDKKYINLGGEVIDV